MDEDGCCVTCGRDIVPCEACDDFAMLESGKVENAELRKRVEALETALHNCCMMAARHRDVDEWNHILRFCHEVGVVGSPLRGSNV